MHRLSLALGALSFTIAASVADAQVPLTPQALGLGGAAVGLARGHQALFSNPANLGLPDSPLWSVSVLQLTTGGVLSGAAISDIPSFANRDDLSDSERDQLFSEVPAAGLDLGYDVRAALGAIQVGRAAVGVSYKTLGNHSLSRDIVELLLYGYEEGRTDYQVDNTAGYRAAFWDVAVAYGASTGPLSLGVTGHYLFGGSLNRSWFSDPRINLIDRDIQLDYVGVTSRGGSGFALDVGMAYQPSPRLTLSGAIGNAYARMDWSDDLYVRSLELDRNDIESGDPVELLNQLEESERPVGDGDAALVRGTTAADLRDGAYPPTTVTLGVGWHATPWTRLGASYYGTATEGVFNGTWDRMASFGIEQRIPLLTLRAGYGNNLDGGSLLSGGVSLGPLDFGLARRSERSASGADQSGWVGVFGLSARTRGVRGS